MKTQLERLEEIRSRKSTIETQKARFSGERAGHEREIAEIERQSEHRFGVKASGLSEFSEENRKKAEELLVKMEKSLGIGAPEAGDEAE